MKPLYAIATLALIGAVALGQGYGTNAVTRTEAIALASSLWHGQSEADVTKYLSAHGLTNSLALGALTSWRRDYGLVDGSSLSLDYKNSPMATNWGLGSGLLQKARIVSKDDVTIAPITLTNAP